MLFDFGKPAVFLPLIIAAGIDDSSKSPADHWAVVQIFIDATEERRSKRAEIRRADIPKEEKERRLTDLGTDPDDTAAIAAATAIIESNGERTFEAAEFLLIDRIRSVPESTQRVALHALGAQIGTDWSLVEGYVDSEAAVLAAYSKIGLDDLADDERRRINELVSRGPEPKAAYAVAVAMAIIEAKGPRALEAAEFLVEQTGSFGATPIGIGRQFGQAALLELVGPNWQVVQNYLDQTAAWESTEKEIRAADLGEDERVRRHERSGTRPKAHRAWTAAIAILDADGKHEKTRLAAEFLLDHPTRGGAARGLKGAQALAAHFPDYDQWPLRLKQVNDISNVHQPAKAFINDLAGSLEDPVARATARYFAASHLIGSADIQSLPEAERAAHEQQALALATGLSAGIANEVFILERQDADGTARPMTFADAERELLYSLRSTTVGGFVSDVTATRLDGTLDSLSNYAGQVVLVDFWATWCGPCIAAFPKLREMTAELPEEYFQIVGINVDAELETAEGYLEDDPLPWVVWHVGEDSEIVRKWRVTGFPTYVLIGPGGRILARNAGTFDEGFRTIIEQAVSEFSEPAAATP